MASVTLEHATKRFGSFTAVQEMDLAIEHAEFVALLGPSGCGKSTTMNMIAGIEAPSEGRICFDGKDVTSVPMARRGVGFVFQNYAIFTHLSVRGNLAFGLEVQGVARPEVDRRVGEMAEFMALSHRLDASSASLSVNELQKLAIGRSAIVEPSIFLLDEPLSNLDAAFREKMRAELRELQRHLRQTMIYVTHDQIEAMGLADRIAVMDNAVLQQFASPAEIYARPRNTFVANFIGAPSMNLIPVRVSDGRVRTASGHVALDSRLAAQAEAHGPGELLLGFRPEDVKLAPEGFGATVAMVETVGRRRIAHFDSAEIRVLGTFARTMPLKAGEQVQLMPDLAKAHLFDPVSGLRLTDTEVGQHG
jgi:multiple sugar transport system ATP-binding protein